MSLGTAAGEAANDATHFTQPSDVVVGPDGSIYVGDGHGGTNSRQRIVKFDADGNFVKDWGETGTGEGLIGVPHGLAFDSQGRLFVADRSNNRILIYDQEGTLLDTWYQFSRNSGIFIDANDILYATDSESADFRNHGRSVEPASPKAWRSMRRATSTPPRSAHAISRSTSGGLKTRPLLSIETPEY